MQNLTEKQKKVLMFIREKIKASIPPTIREIAHSFGFSSTGTVRDYLNTLEKKGYLKRTNNKSRSIELLQTSTGIPILGTIPAGKPNLAYENIEGFINTDDLFLGRLSFDDVFALKVKGDSMSEAGIIDGDIAIIKKQPVADTGDIIAALIEETNEVTLKRLKNKNNRIFLEPANKNYQPIYKNFTVIGKLLTIIRKYH